MAYTTQTKIERYLGKSLTSGQSAEIANWISAVTRYIEKYTGVMFEQEAAATRYFDGNGLSEIFIDDFLSITSIDILETDGSVLQSLTEGEDDDYITYPYNTTPKYKLILVTSASIGNFPKRSKCVKITGTWNYSTTVPADIELVATMLVAQVLQLSGSGGLEVNSESLGDYSVSYGDVTDLDNMSAKIGAKNVLDRYVIYRLN